MIEFGIESEQEGHELYDLIFEALSVKDTSEEDVFGMLISKELRDWFDLNNHQVNWGKQIIPVEFNRWNTKDIECPSKSFVQDIKKIIELKGVLTRFQWTNMLSGLLRLALPMHLIWIYKNHIMIQMNIIHLMQGENLSTLQKRHSTENSLFIGDSVSDIRNVISNYKKSQMFIDLFIKYLHNNNLTPSDVTIDNIDDLERFYDDLHSFNLHNSTWKSDFFKAFYETLALKSKELSIFGSELKGRFWFIKHILEQGSAEGLEHKRELDQYFWLKQKGDEFFITPGAGQCLMLTFLSSHSKSYCSVNDLKQHLKRYGLSIKDLSNNAFVDTLRQMGLITDSPDSENGLTIHNPLNLN
jgi:hypothetical protein